MTRQHTIGLVGLALLSLGACASAPSATNNAVTASAMPTSLPFAYDRGSAPFTRPSMMEPAFQCIRDETATLSTPVRVAVSNIVDRTGKISYEAAQGGTLVTQGASEMVISAVGELGDNVWQIERYDTGIMTTEIEMGKQSLLGTGPRQVQPLIVGQYLPSDYYIAGAVTNVNGNIRSGGFGININGYGVNQRYFVMDVDVDLRIVHTASGRVVKTSTKTKQVIGVQSDTGAFAFQGDYLLDIQAGEKNQEALNLGVRTALEYAVIELMPYAFGSTQPKRCAEYADQIMTNRIS
jgi:curli production assembly/transport component CsgG/holdfast attachment protein HfaB